MHRHLLWLALAACAAEAPPVAVESNTLGVARIAIEHTSDGPERTLAIHGFDASGGELATLALRTGAIRYTPEPDVMPAERTFGTELTVNVAGDERGTYSKVTPATYAHDVGRYFGASPKALAFLAIPTVARELRDEAGFVLAPAAAEAADQTYTAYQGWGAQFRSDRPTAAQACYTAGDAFTRNTVHVVSSTQISYRFAYDQGYVCRNSNGTTGCTNAGCYYGPCGFANPSPYNGSGYPVVVAAWQYNEFIGYWTTCEGSFAQTPQTPQFADVTPTCNCTGCNADGSATPAGCTHW